MECFLVIYIITSFTFCILREWFPVFRQGGISKVICLLNCCWNWGEKKKEKIKSQNAFLNRRELIWKRNEGLRCQTEIGSLEVLQHYKGAISEPADGILASYIFVPVEYWLECVLTDLIPTQPAEYGVMIVSLWLPGCPLQPYYLQLIFPFRFRFLLQTF